MNGVTGVCNQSTLRRKSGICRERARGSIPESDEMKQRCSWVGETKTLGSWGPGAGGHGSRGGPVGQGNRMQCGLGTGEWSETTREGWAGASFILQASAPPRTSCQEGVGGGLFPGRDTKQH